MDKTDVILTQLLMQNSRRPYRELAEILNLSINAIHKRIQELIKIGILRDFTAKIDLSAFEMSIVAAWVWGRSECKLLDEIITKLGANSSIYWISFASGNLLYLGAHLEDISKLEPFLDFVKKEGKIPDPTFAIIDLPVHHPSSTTRKRLLSSLDYKIIFSLNKNSRKSVTEISKELNFSTKTIKRRLSKMIDEGLIELSVEFYPDASNDISAVFHLILKASINKSEVISLLINNYSPNILAPLVCNNLPNLILCVVWANTMKEINDIRQRFENEDVFESVKLNILHTGHIFDTWRDEFLRKKVLTPKTKINS